MTSSKTAGATDAAPRWATAALVLADGAVFWGKGVGAARHAVGEVCFNTSMTGYQEIITDPSYAGQIITFTFPHIGNVGTNLEDIESINPAARGVVLRGDITEPANWRAAKPLDDWLKSHNLPGICGVDTRAITRRIRDGGAPSGVVVHAPDGKFDIPKLRKTAQDWPGLDGMDLAIEVTDQADLQLGRDQVGAGQGLRQARQAQATMSSPSTTAPSATSCAASPTPAARSRWCRRPPRPRTSCATSPTACSCRTARAIRRRRRATAVPAIQGVLDKKVPLFGICLGHQILALALGGKTRKMERGHRGANQPVKDLTTGKVEITSQNHGFCVLPEVAARERRGDARLAVRRHQRGPALHRQAGLLGAVPSRGLARPERQPLSLRPLRRDDRQEQAASETVDHAQAHRHQEHPGHRRRPDRHRPGLRVRLFRRAGLQGAEGRGLPRRPGQFQPGDDHDRSGPGRRHLYRADHAGHGRPRSSRRSGPTPCCRPWAARPRSTRRWRCTATAALQEVQGRADRRQRRGDRQGRGPPAVPRGHDQDRPGMPEERGRAQSRGGDRRARPCRPAGDHPPVLHPGRHRRRHRLQPRRIFRASCRAASTPRRSARCWSRNRCSAGKSTRWRSCATAPTTASSSARSRTSTRWASTPAIRSPSRRR